MKTIWTIGKHSLKLLVNDRLAFIWMLLMPCFYIFIFGNVFRYDSDRSNAKAYLGIINNDRGILGEQFMNKLQSENISIDTLDSEPENPPTRYLTIPDSFTTTLLNKQEIKLVLKKRPDSDIEAEVTAEMGLTKAAYRLLADMTELSISDKEISTGNIKELDNREPLVKFTPSWSGKHKIIPSGYNFQVPANIVMFTLLITFIYAGSYLMEEKISGALRRIRIAPVSFYQLFLGKLLGVTFIALVQISLLLLVGRFAFGVYYGDSLFSLILLVFTFAVAVGSMGLCLGFVVKEEEKLIAISIILALSMSALSGCWWPAEVMPAWMQHAASVLPSGMAIRAFHHLISFGHGFESIWPYLLGLTGTAILFSLLFAVVLGRFVKD